MSVTPFVDITCASCGWSRNNTPRAGAAQQIRGHMDFCPHRFYGDPLFGYAPAWHKYQLGPNEQIEIAWTNPGYWSPLNLERAA